MWYYLGMVLLQHQLGLHVASNRWALAQQHVKILAGFLGRAVFFPDNRQHWLEFDWCRIRCTNILSKGLWNIGVTYPASKETWSVCGCTNDALLGWSTNFSPRRGGRVPKRLKRYSWSGKILHHQFMITLIHQSKWHAKCPWQILLRCGFSKNNTS